MIQTPTQIDTARLLLRSPTPEDAEAIFEYGRDPEVTRFMNWPTHTRVETVQEFLRVSLSRLAAGEELSWVITVRPVDRAIGMISCRIRGHSADFGYALNRSFWNHGYGTEAARAVVDWLSARESIYRVWATCDVGNLASARVLEKSGLTREGTLRRWDVRPNLATEPRDAFMYSKVRSEA